MNKKLISLILILMLCLSSVMPALAVTSGTTLRDNASQIRYANGMMGGLFYPDESVTRFSMSEMLFYLIDTKNVTPDHSFSDIAGAYGETALATLAGAGILKGFEDHSIRPNEYLTRAEFATVLCRLLNLTGSPSKSSAFSDTAGHWAENAISLIQGKGLILGFPDGTFRPDEEVTRAQCVMMINRMINKVDQPEKESYFSDLSSDHWAYGAIMASASGTNCNTYLKRDNVNFEDMTYTLPSLELYNLQCEEKLWNLLCAQTFEQFSDAIADCNNVISQISLASTLAQIHYNQDNTKDTYLKELYRINDYIAVAQKFITTRNQYMLDSPVRYIYEQIYGSISWMEDYNALYTPEMTTLLTEESDYVYQYQALRATSVVEMNGQFRPLEEALSLISSSDAITRTTALKAVNDYYEKYRYLYDNILSDLVDVRTRQAKAAGLDSYTQLYPKLNMLDSYTREDINGFRKNVKKYLVPLFSEIGQKAAAAQGRETIRYGIDASALMESAKPLYDMNTTYEKILELFDDISPQTAQYINYMSNHNLIDVFPTATKTNAGYTTYLPKYNVPFIFAMTVSSNDMINTLTHELGHGLAMFRTYDVVNPSPSKDIAETHSYSTQLLISTKFDQLYDNADAAQKSLIYSFLSLILSTCVLDEYQETIYNNPQMSQSDRNSTYALLQKSYMGYIYDYSDYPSFGNGKAQMNDNHTFMSPFYAVDYALALSNALQIWEQMENDFDEGFNTYIKFIDLPSGVGFNEAVEYAGLHSPFEESTLKTLSEKLREILLSK